MSDILTYPAPEEGESGTDYWDRVRQLGLPFPWDADRSLPPGSIKIDYEWSVQPPNFDPEIWPTYIDNESGARSALEYRAVSGSVLVRRVRWLSVGLWEEVKEND